MIPSYSNEVLRGFIAVEGIDGAGTTTQSLLLEQNLQAAGRKTILGMEPTAGPIGTLIKQIMRGRLRACADRAMTEKQLAYLFAADRFDHLYNDTDGITKQLSEGFTVISTRYFFSSYAYNARSAEGFDLVDRLNRDFPLPEIVVYLDAPLQTSLSRLENRDVREFYEREEELRRVRESYARVLEPLGSRVIRVVAEGSKEELASRVLAGVINSLDRS